MTAQSVVASRFDPEGSWVFRVGGIAASALVVGYFLTFPIYFWVGDHPAGGVEAQLAYYADHAAGWWAIAILMVCTDLLVVPAFVAIYLALRHLGKGLMAAALAFTAVLFVILDLAVTWTAYPSLITAGVNYGAAVTEAQRSALAAGAAYASALLESPVVGAYAILFPSVGIMLAGLVMLKGVFSKATAYVAVATGLTGILWMGSFFVDGLGAIRYINALLATFFYLLVGVRLRRLGRGLAVAPQAGDGNDRIGARGPLRGRGSSESRKAALPTQ